MANHPISHIEIPVTSPDTAGAFYHDVFGWKIETNQTYNYVKFESEGGLRNRQEIKVVKKDSMW